MGPHVAFFDPRPPVLDDGRRYALRFTPRDDRPVTVGLLANGFPDSMAFLDAVGDTLRSALGDVTFERVEKASPPVPLTDAQRASLSRCDAVIAAYGH